jgi:hypothetical protein
MNQFIETSQRNLEALETGRKKSEAYRKILETHVAHMACTRFLGDTIDNPNIESCSVVELRSRIVHTPMSSKSMKKKVSEVVERTIVEGNDENECKLEKNGETKWVFVYKGSILRKSNRQVIKDSVKPEELL